MRMQSAVTQMEDMSVSVEMDSLEMELIAMVWHYDTGSIYALNEFVSTTITAIIIASEASYLVRVSR